MVAEPGGWGEPISNMPRALGEISITQPRYPPLDASDHVGSSTAQWFDEYRLGVAYSADVNADKEWLPMNVAAEPLQDLVCRIFECAGCSSEEAGLVGLHLIESNLMGHDSHGVIRVAPYVGLMKDGKLTANQHIEIVADGGATVTVDGRQGFGQVIAKEAIDLGIDRARRHGVSVIGVRNSGHMGRIGAWAEQAAVAGFASLHFVNTTGYGIQVAPYGGSDRRLSVNPIALGVPRPDHDPIIHDMSTGAIAAGKIRVARNRGARLPEGAIIDNRGQPSRNPEAFYTDPPGALTTAAGHKGHGLSIFVELFAGAMVGGGTGHPDNPSADRPINNLLAILIDPERLAGTAAMGGDMDRFVDFITASPPVSDDAEVLLPGMVERRTKTERLANGIPLDPKTRQQVSDAAQATGLTTDTIKRGFVDAN